MPQFPGDGEDKSKRREVSLNGKGETSADSDSEWMMSVSRPLGYALHCVYYRAENRHSTVIFQRRVTVKRICFSFPRKAFLGFVAPFFITLARRVFLYMYTSLLLRILLFHILMHKRAAATHLVHCEKKPFFAVYRHTYSIHIKMYTLQILTKYTHTAH
jgi:hypothetical protein